MIRSVLLAMAVCSLAATLFAAEPAPFYLHDGDRVVFYGIARLSVESSGSRV